MKPVIAVLDDYEQFVPTLEAYRRLREQLPQADIRVLNRQPLDAGGIAQLGDVEYLVLIRERTRVTAELLALLPALRAIVQTGSIGVGATAHVDAAACAQRGVRILEGKTDGIAAAELTWALILAAHRRLPQYAASLRAGGWHQGSGGDGLGEVLHGKTFGILGYGRIGRMLGNYAKAFGMQVLAWGREGSLSNAQADGVAAAGSRAELFAASDVLTVQLRQNEQTRHSVRLEDLRLMKPDALFVNTSRAGLIAPGALLAALREGRPGRAAVDVFDSEPVAAGDPLLQLDNVWATPHVGYVERNSYEVLFGSAFDNLLELLRQAPAR